MSQKVLIIVDMLNDFLDERGALFPVRLSTSLKALQDQKTVAPIAPVGS